MYVTISGRHCAVPEPVRRHAAERLRRLTRFEPRAVGAEANFEVVHGVYVVEARFIVAGGRPVIARGAGDGFRAALDRTAERLGRQLKSRRERRRAQRAPAPAKRLAPAGGS